MGGMPVVRQRSLAWAVSTPAAAAFIRKSIRSGPGNVRNSVAGLELATWVSIPAAQRPGRTKTKAPPQRGLLRSGPE